MAVRCCGNCKFFSASLKACFVVIQVVDTTKDKWCHAYERNLNAEKTESSVETSH